MRRKEYVESAKKCILNRVKFHAPIVYDNHVDKGMLEKFGMDASLPVFKFEKKLNNKLLKAFQLANMQEKFSLLIEKTCLGKIKQEKLSKMQNVFVFDKNICPASFVQTINKLNINYSAATNYNHNFKDKFFKVNGQILNANINDFTLHKLEVVNDFFVEYLEFLLNGNNFFVKLQNKSLQQKTAVLELNIPLEKGYYFFKHQPKCVGIENLRNGQKMFFNFQCPNAKFSFSEVDGLENSVYACLNVTAKLSLMPGQETFVFFNFGQQKFCLKTLSEIEKFLALSQKKCYEKFNLKVLTKNSKFDMFFNKTLPQKIWIDWLNGLPCDSLVQKYLLLKKLFVRGTKELSLVNFKEVGLRELEIFNGKCYKKIVVVSGQEKFLRVGRTFFWNVSGITNCSLKNSEPMAVCFGND